MILYLVISAATQLTRVFNAWPSGRRLRLELKSMYLELTLARSRRGSSTIAWYRDKWLQIEGLDINKYVALGCRWRKIGPYWPGVSARGHAEYRASTVLEPKLKSRGRFYEGHICTQLSARVASL